MEEPLTGPLTEYNLSRLALLLRSGRIAVLPTDTIYGLHCISIDGKAVERIRSLKGRSGSSGFIVLASSVDMAEDLVGEWPGRSRDLAARTIDMPLTMLLPSSPEAPEYLTSGGKLAVRIPGLRMLRRLIELTGSPLVSTSVNRSGEAPLNRIGVIRREFPGLAAYISRRGAGRKTPSAVVDLCGSRPVIVRQGAAEVARFIDRWDFRDRKDEPGNSAR